MRLGDGLEVIRTRAFAYCRSLERIVIPRGVKVIDKWAFEHCSQLTTVELNHGLEKIGANAFRYCTLLREISIPPSVKAIGHAAFKYCSQLTTAVVLCEEIEEFVLGDPMRGWWNDYPGVHEKRLRAYCFLVRCNIPNRVGLVGARKLRTNIHEMLRGIPLISPKGLGFYFDSIDSKLSVYEGSTVLELAIWKTKIIEQTDGNIELLTNAMKMGCRIDSLSMVDIIVPIVLTFF